MSNEITDIEKLQAANAFAVYNHIEPVKLERDHVLYKLDIRPESKNPRGYVHGGALCAMAEKTGVELPICQTVHAVLHEGADAGEAMSRLFMRSLKHEF